MEIGHVISIARSSLLEILILSSPVLITAVSVGLVVSIVQAITSIQEQTLTFVPKVISIIVILIIVGPLLGTHMIDFTRNLWEQMHVMSR